jgi:hypothetical protein
MKRILSLLLGLSLIVPQSMQAMQSQKINEPTAMDALYVLANAGGRTVWGFSEKLADLIIAGGHKGMYSALKYSQKALNSAVKSFENPSQSGASLSPRTVLAAAITAGMAYGAYHLVVKPSWNWLVGNDKGADKVATINVAINAQK